MIFASIQNISKAEATEHEGGGFHGPFSTVRILDQSRDPNHTVTLFLPAGTAAAVAACINVAVAAGAQAAEKVAAE